jgi:hypothetical protein
MNDMENLRTFADQLWKYMVPKLDSKFASNVSYFRAQVVSNPGNNKLEVQRPVENGTLTLPCVRAMSGAQAGQQVVALVMGSMSNAIIVGDGKLNVPGGGGDAGIANFQAQPDGSLVITLTNGITFTATPHDPTKQNVLTFDDVPTQGSDNPVKSSGIKSALDNKVDKVAGKGLSTNDYTNADKNKLAGIEAGAQVNQNAFANVKVGSTTVAADAEQDTLELVAGNNITITPDATNDKVTIATTAEVNQNAFSNVKVGSTTIAADSKTDTLTLVAGDNVTLTPNATNDSVTIAATDTTYSSKAAASGGTAVSLVTTGEKYNWNHKQDALTFDSTPTAGSNNPVTSEGIKTALDGKADLNHDHDDLYYSLTNGVAIPSNADLNDATYRTPGNYICSTAVVSHTVKHTPGYDETTLVNTSMGTFKLFVGYTTAGTYISQELRTSNDGAIYYRYYNKTNSSWVAWKAVRGSASLLIGELSTATANITDNTLITTSAANGETGTWYRRAAVRFWNYIKGKADAVYAAITHTHDASDIVSGILPAERGGTQNGNGYIQMGQKSGTTLGTKATAEGEENTASSAYCHAEGWGTTASSVHAHAEGKETTASGGSSHAEGYKTVASDSYAHAEGYMTTASGSSSHAEGDRTTASGESSHAEGYLTVASGKYSHAEGRETTADGDCQHVFGKYNIADTTNVEIVGWGANSSTKKNIRTLSTSGNEWIAGTLTQASDARLKEVQGEIPDLSKVRAVRFRWKNGDDKEHLGYLAQDVEGIAPYLVGVDSNGYKSLNYIALLTAKVEMLEREIEKLKQ